MPPGDAHRSQGQATTADTLSTSVSLPYEWASETAEFGLEFVKNALEIGESLPMIGACFTLCLIIAKARPAACGRASKPEERRTLIFLPDSGLRSDRESGTAS